MRTAQRGGRRRGRAPTLGIGLGDTFRMRSVAAGRSVARSSPCGSSACGRTCSTTARSRFVTVSPAFYRAYGDRELELSAPRNAIKVRLRRGSADLPAFQRATERIAGEREFQFTVEDDEAGQAAVGLPPPGAGALARGRRSRAEPPSSCCWRRASRGRSSWSRSAIGSLLALGMTRTQLAVARPGPDRDHRRARRQSSPSRWPSRCPRWRPSDGPAATSRIPASLSTRPRSPSASRPRAIAAFVPAPWLAAVRALGRARTHVRGSAVRSSAPAGALARAGAPPTLVGGVRMAIPGSRGATAGTARATAARRDRRRRGRGRRADASPRV